MIDFDLIERTRKAKKISITELCKTTNMNQSTYNRWINEKSEPTVFKLTNLCDVLEINISDIFK